jgi:hypothetical protein
MGPSDLAEESVSVSEAMNANSEVRGLTDEEMYAVTGGMVAEFSVGGTSVIIWASETNHAVFVCDSYGCYRG